jgi:hypothetical protein
MNKAVPRILTRTAVAFLAATSLPALAAGVQRTFVAHDGLDANPCSITLPCRAFAAAMAQTSAGGEIIVLDSAGYGPVTIDKSISIIAPAGIYAGVSNGAGNGIVVNAPGGNVVLRGLDINGLGTSSGSGILHQAAASLVIDHCTVTGFGNSFTQVGIAINAGPVTISDTVVKNNLFGGVAVRGTDPDPANFVRATILRSRIEANGSAFGFASDAGVAVLGGALVTVEDSVAVGNFRGFSACGSGAGEPLGGVLSIDRSLADRNTVGVFVAPNAVACAVRVSNSTITNSTLYGIEQQGGNVVTSLSNNFVYSNAAAETFGLTTVPK